MKKIFYFAFSLILIALAGCEQPTAPTSGGGGGLGTGGGDNGGGGGGAVTIQVQGAANGQGLYLFSLKPSATVTFTTITPSVVAANYSEEIDFSGEGEWQANNFAGFLQYDVNVIQTGQAWSFKFVGKTTADNKEFTVTTNYTIP